MYRVATEIKFCYGHRLLGYEGPCQHPHGHNCKVEVYLKGDQLDHRHILVDFGDVEKNVLNWILKNLDHKMILQKNDPLVKPLQDLGEPVFLLETSPTAEMIAKLIYDHCLSEKLPLDEVRVWETDACWAAYRKD